MIPAQNHDSNGHAGSKTQGVGHFQRFSAIILSLLLLLAPVGFWMAGRVLTPRDMSAYILDVSHWLPKKSQWLNDLEKFSEVAGQERSNVIRISWPGCTSDDPRLDRFAASLEQTAWGDSMAGISAEKIFADVITIDAVVGKLRAGNLNLDDEQIHRQLQNVLIGPSGTTCVIATLATREPVQRKLAIDRIYEVASTTEGLNSADIYLFGGPVYTRQVDESGAKLASIITPLSALVSLLCAWLCLRNLMVVITVFFNAIACSCTAIASLYLSGAVMDPLLMLLPGFWFVMAMSSGIHFINYYFDVARLNEAANEDGTNVDLAGQSVKIAFRPAFLATLTTCIGLAALCITDILPVRRFGFHASIGLVCSFVMQFLFLPSWLHSNRKRIKVLPQSAAGTADAGWIRYGEWASGLGPRTVFMFAAILIIAAIGFTRLGFSNKLSDQYSKQSTVNTDAAWFEEHIGPLLPFEVLVRFANDDPSRPSDRLRYVNELQNRIEATGIPCKTLSATAIVPWSDGSGARQSVVRSVLDSRMRRQLPALAETGLVLVERDAELWRITVFAYNSVDVSMNDYFSAIQSAVEAQARQSASEPGGVSAASISYAGLGSRMAVITQKLGGGLIQSCFTSAILISLVVIIALRSLTLGLTAMLPNIFPVLIAFGAYGYFQPRLDIGSIMTASIAMGIAVDDTIHFMYWFRQGITANLPRVAAVKLAINKCGRAIASTSLICGLGFVVFSWSDFMPAVRFGQLLFGMLAAALVGDLLFLPALLLALPGQMGRTRIPAQE